MRREVEADAASPTSAYGVTVGHIVFSVVKKVSHPLTLGKTGGTIGEAIDHLYAQVVQDYTDGYVTRLEFELTDEHAEAMAYNIHMGNR